MSKRYRCCSWCDGNGDHKDFVRGGVNEKDFLDEYPHVKKRTKKKRVRKTRPGCAANDFGSHIYVWTTEYNNSNAFYEYYGYHKHEGKFCAGCGKREFGALRLTEKYEAKNSRRFKKIVDEFAIPERGKPRSARRYWRRDGDWVSKTNFRFEEYDEDFQNWCKMVAQRRGLNIYDSFFNHHYSWLLFW